MKLFIATKSHVIGFAFNSVVRVERALAGDPSDANLIVTDSSEEAVKMLEKYPKAEILIALPGFNRELAAIDARALERAYPSRVYVRPIVTKAEDEEESAAAFILSKVAPTPHARPDLNDI